MFLPEVVEDIPDHSSASGEPTTKPTPSDSQVLEVGKRGKSILRSEKEKDARRKLDGDSCIVLGTINPEICHIVPHRFNKTALETTWLRSSQNDVAHLLNLRYRDLATLFAQLPGVTGNRGWKVETSDQRWNLLSLDAQIQDWWDKCYIALKCLGVTKPLTGDGEAIATLTLQFHWMPRKANNEQHLTIEQRTVQNWTDQFKTSYGDPTIDEPPCRLANGHTIKTGDLFYVRIAEKMVEKMEHAFEVRWALTRILAIAGGVGVLDVEQTPDYFEKYGEYIGLSSWPVIDFNKECERVARAGFEEEEYCSDSDVDVPEESR